MLSTSQINLYKKDKNLLSANDFKQALELPHISAYIVKLLFAFLSSRESELLFSAESFVLVYDYNCERISKERNAIFQGIMRYK